MKIRLALTQPQRLVLQAVLQLQCARVDPVGLRDAALAAAARNVIAAGLSGIAESTPVGAFYRFSVDMRARFVCSGIDQNLHALLLYSILHNIIAHFLTWYEFSAL